MTSAKSKRGRKPQPYRTAAGDYVNGLLYRPHDKRWILSDSRTFTAPDEAKAIERFYELTGGEDRYRAKQAERNQNIRTGFDPRGHG